VIYGFDTLLYIGKTTRFTNRIKQHIWMKFEQNVSVRKASISISLSEIEKILIYSHSPAYNSTEITGYGTNLDKDILIRNYGEKGLLLPEISGSYWIDFYEKHKGWGKTKVK
jgi:hypothetical protein